MALLTDRLPGAASPPLLTGRTGPAAVGGDAFDSGMWPSHRQEFLGDPAAWRNDPAVAVLAPRAAEDSRHVPFLIDATAVAQPIRRIVVTIDYSPFPKAIVFRPGRALPLLGFGVKYEVGGALRASAETGAETGRANGWSARPMSARLAADAARPPLRTTDPTGSRASANCAPGSGPKPGDCGYGCAIRRTPAWRTASRRIT